MKEQRDSDAADAVTEQQDAQKAATKAAKGKVTFARGFPEMTPGGAAPATTAPVKVATPAEAAKLKKGTRYIAPDGTVYTR